MNHSPVKNTEMLARFIFTPQHINKNDGSIRWQVFEPASDGTSVTRQDFISPEKVLQLGEKIARVRPLPTKLYAKAEILTQKVRELKIDVTSKPSKNNPNHANIIKWPPDKNEVMIVCKELLIRSSYIKN